jgi:hypothetical protein
VIISCVDSALALANLRTDFSCCHRLPDRGQVTAGPVGPSRYRASAFARSCSFSPIWRPEKLGGQVP